jgi:multiple sugar transport system substrate-binding protein
VELSRVPFADLYEQIMLGFVTGTLPFDALLIPSAWLPDFAPYLTPVPESILASPVVDDIHPIYRDALMRWGDQWKALTIDGDLHFTALEDQLDLVMAGHVTPAQGLRAAARAWEARP